MKQRLVSDPQLQPLLAQYVPLELKINDPEFAVWTSRYKPSGKGIPMIFIVSSDGEEIYNRSGAPAGDGLAELLMRGIQQTGGVKTPGVAAGARHDKAFRTLSAARRLLARDDPAAAIALLLPAVDAEPEAVPAAAGGEDQAPAAAGKPIDPQIQLRQLLEELQQRADVELEGAMQDVRESTNALVGAVRLLRVDRLYGQLPPIKQALEEGWQILNSAPEGEALLDQAKMIDKAREFEERKNKRLAVISYRKVISDHPDSLAARLSQQRVQQLTGEPAADSPAEANATAAVDALRRWTDRSGSYSVVAALVGSDERSVRLRKEDGEIVTVPLAALSDESQQYVATQTAP